MTAAGLALRSLAFYRRIHVAVAIGVACAVAVLSGALLVGRSVQDSLASIATSRLGRTNIVVSAERPFGEGLCERLRPRLGPGGCVPLLALTGAVEHQPSGRRAGAVQVYGVDHRFFAFHATGAESPRAGELMVSPDLAAELLAAPGDIVMVQVARLSNIPLDSVRARKDAATRSLRLRYQGALMRESMGEFSPAARQGPVRAVFLSLEQLQRDLEQPGRANLLLISGPPTASAVQETLRAAATSDDLGLRTSVLESEPAILIESSSGMLPDAAARAVEAAAARQSLAVTPLLTWLANRMAVGDRMVPYSLVTAIGPTAAGDPALARLLATTSSDADRSAPIVLSEWAASDLHARPGDALNLEYYRWTDDGRLVAEQAVFRVAGAIPMRGLAVDRRLAPEYPGITSSNSLSDWDPPFPIDLQLVRPVDERYWREFRTAPKAFIPLGIGQRLWRTRHGQLTSLRLAQSAASADLESIAGQLRVTLPGAIDPLHAGFNVVDVRSQNLSAAAGATDFATYFASFSAFLMVSSQLLTALFFRLGVEQRLSQIGVLRAVGYSLGRVRSIFLIEGLLVSVIGAALGVVLAIGWAALMMHGLRTWWVDAVGTTLLELHLNGWALVGGATGALLACALSLTVTIRGLGRTSPRELLTGSKEVALSADSRPARRIAATAIAAAVILTGLSFAGRIPADTGFFGAGILVLVAGLAEFRHWLGRRARTTPGVISLGVRNASWRPGRSVTSAGLLASAVFLIVSVEAFRRPPGVAGILPAGTGGFALIAESTTPIVHDPSSPQGREALGLSFGPGDRDLDGVAIVPMRLRPGDDASCLNLYQPRQPRVVGVPDRFIEAGRFRFQRSLASTPADRQNPWRLLRRAVEDGIVPAIADATSLEYVLHAKVGDVIAIDSDTARPIRLRIVASLDHSMLQSELLISERDFLQLFPDLAGYRVLLIELAAQSGHWLEQVGQTLEKRLEPFGVDVQESARRLAAYERVENTYLSTFQALGGLGLLLGSLGLAAVSARNVLERRREMALLGAAGFTGRHLQTIVLAEHLTLVAAGLAIGIAAALVAIAPGLVSRGAHLPAVPFAWLATVAAAALLSATWTTRTVRRLPLVQSLRSE